MRVVLLVGALLVCRSASAQDAQYWSQQYGTRSELLGGAVVGSPQDLSTTFYNPGGLAYLEDSFLLSAAALEYQWIGLEESSGALTELSNDRFGTAPSVVTGTFPRGWIEGTLAYSFLTRQKLEFRINSWQSLAPGAGADSIATNTLIDARVSESWGGLTWSRPVGEFGIGATLYGVYRSQRGRSEWVLQPNPTGNPGVVVASINDHSYWHYRLQAKVGFYWNLGRTGLGLTMTTPGLPLFGGGKAAFYRSLVPADSTTSAPTTTEAVVVSDPEVTYHSPMSVAIGSRYQTGQSAVYATLEWFDSVDRYRVVESPDVPESGVGASLDAKLTQELDSVLNVSVGYEYSPRERLTLFGSFLTDFSAAVDDPSAAHPFATWDIYQVTGGAAFTAGSVDFTLGLSFAAGSDPVALRNDLPIEAVFESVEARYRRLKAFIGFEFRS